MKRLVFILFLLVSVLVNAQDIKPISPNFKALQSPSWSYYLNDSTIWMYKNSTYGWTKIFSAKTVQHKIDSLVVAINTVGSDTVINAYTGKGNVTARNITITWPKEFSTPNYYTGLRVWYNETIGGKSVQVTNAVYDFIKTTSNITFKVDTITGYYEYMAVDTANLFPITLPDYEPANANIQDHIINILNPHNVTKAQVGLGNVDNTSDLNKPISTATATALNLKANIVSPTFTGTVSGITKSMVGLSNVDNTSDVNKPVSTAQQSALDLKANLASPTFTGTVGGITKSMVGLSNVDNTSDINKPVSTAQQTAIDAKVSDAAFSATWDAVTGIAPSKNAIYDKITSLEPINYCPTTLTVTYGTLNQGTVADLCAVGGTDVIVQERVANPPFEIRLTFTNVLRLDGFKFYGRYAGGADHNVHVEAYNNATSGWDYIGNIGTSTTKQWYSYGLNLANNYLSSGTVQVRLIHTDSGIISHQMIIDYANVNYGGGGGTGFITAGSVDYTPTGNIAATNVQAAINELDTEKLGTGATTASITSSTDKRYVTDAQLVVIGNTSGTNSGNQTLTVAGTTSPTIALSGSNTATFAGAGGTTLSQSGGTITITSSSSSSFSGVGVWRNSSFNSSGVYGFDSEKFDTDSYHDNVTNNQRITFPSTGYYQVTYSFSGALSSGNTYVTVDISDNTDTYISRNFNETIGTWNGTQAKTVTGTYIGYFTAGQYIFFNAYGDVGWSIYGLDYYTYVNVKKL